jgi:hypothetical protein
MTNDRNEDIRSAYPIPPHIQAIANAIYSDLMYGPTYAVIRDGDVTKFTVDDFSTDTDCLDVGPNDRVVQTYVSPLADALREYIDGLPSELWYDMQSGGIQDSAPTADVYEDEDDDGNTIEVVCEPDWDDWYVINHGDIVAALFDKTIANEFR